MIFPLAIRLNHRPCFLAFVYITISSMLKSYPSVSSFLTCRNLLFHQDQPWCIIFICHIVFLLFVYTWQKVMWFQDLRSGQICIAKITWDSDVERKIYLFDWLIVNLKWCNLWCLNWIIVFHLFPYKGLKEIVIINQEILNCCQMLPPGLDTYKLKELPISISKLFDLV